MGSTTPNVCTTEEECLCLALTRGLQNVEYASVSSVNLEALYHEPLGDTHLMECCWSCHDENEHTGKRPSPFASVLNADINEETLRWHDREYEHVVPKKRRKVSNDDPTLSLLLQSRPEVLRHVRSFLTLKDALFLRSTCHKLHNDDYDAYRYSRLLNCHTLVEKGYSGLTCDWDYLHVQDRALMRNQNDDKLRAILRNEHIPSYHLRRFLWSLIKLSETDNASAASILLDDDRCEVDPFMLDQALRRDFGAIAAVLEQDDRIKAGIQMCATCNLNIGAYECFRDLDCSSLPEPTQGHIWCSWDDLPAKFRKPKKYCRSCVLADKKNCKVCKEYLCPHCFRSKNFGCCEECHSILCLDDFLSKQQPVVVCDECPRVKCRSCLRAEEGWLEVIDGGFPITLCDQCRGSYCPGHIPPT